MGLGSSIHASDQPRITSFFVRVYQRLDPRWGADSFSLPHRASISMIPEPYEPFDSNRKEDTIFLLGSMFIVIFLFLL